jgi:AcrR family transcriptional regulator
MSPRHPKSPVLSRARSPQEKAEVREAFIAAGRRLLADEGPDAISLRRIAAMAGYAPGTIYQYFADHQELYFQIRAHDMQAATDILRALVARTRDPAKRVQKLFIGAAAYWLDHMDEFLVIFPPATRRELAPVAAGRAPFGQSLVVQDSLELYYETVAQFFATLSRPPMPSRLAADMLIAAVHGTIVFPRMTRTMEWSDSRVMVDSLVKTIMRQWGTD